VHPALFERATVFQVATHHLPVPVQGLAFAEENPHARKMKKEKKGPLVKN
jgi:hypothetical protein